MFVQKHSGLSLVHALAYIIVCRLLLQ